MVIYVNQQEYKIVDKEESIGSFGAGPCTILCLYDDDSKLCAHLDALTQEEIFNIEINKYLIGKDETKINIILTSSGLNENLILRNKILEYLRKLGLENKEQIVETTQIVLNNKNDIETEFEPEKKFDLSNMDDTLEKELILKSKKLKEMVSKFAKSRQHSPNLDKFGRQKPNYTNARYDYSQKKWVNKEDIFKLNLVRQPVVSNMESHFIKLNQVRQPEKKKKKKIYFIYAEI